MADDEGLQDLRSGLELARAAWPGVTLSVDDLEARLRARGLGEADLIDRVGRSTLDDLVLATACLAGDRAALRTFERLLRRAVTDCMHRIGAPISDAPEIVQRFAERLLVPGPGRAPALASYEGRGALLAWLHVGAARELLMLWRAQRPWVEPDAATTIAAGIDPELGALKADARARLEAAFASAIAELDAEARLLLAYYYVDGLTYRDVARLTGLDASTICRRLLRIRRGLLEEIRRALGELPSDDGSDALVDLASSQLDVSLGRLLRVPAAAARP